MEAKLETVKNTVDILIENINNKKKDRYVYVEYLSALYNYIEYSSIKLKEALDIARQEDSDNEDNYDEKIRNMQPSDSPDELSDYEFDDEDAKQTQELIDNIDKLTKELYMKMMSEKTFIELKSI